MSSKLSRANGGSSAGASAAESASRASRAPTPEVAADLVSPEERHARISQAAYRRAESRGFESGGELEDWLFAEREVDSPAD
jgi:Protein of unknown function (DUF2934)